MIDNRALLDELRRRKHLAQDEINGLNDRIDDLDRERTDKENQLKARQKLMAAIDYHMQHLEFVCSVTRPKIGTARAEGDK